jgi:predicted phosphoadenosine phosphosulfate sulfurtransferase
MSQFEFKRTADEGNVLEAARARVDLLFREYDTVLVSFSGGKDSTAVFNLCLEAAIRHNRLPLLTIFFDEEAIAPDTEDYVRRVSQMPEVDLRWYCVPLRHRNGAAMDSGYWFPWASEDKHLWVRDLPPEAITEIEGLDLDTDEHRAPIDELVPYVVGPEHGRTAAVLGIRAQESLTRLKAVSVSSRLHNWITPPWKNAPWIVKAYPVYDWTTADVWTAPKKLGWDYNRYYDILEMMGVGHASQRCAPPYGDEPLRGLHEWHEAYPELWDKMVDRVPGAAAASRYANTELYGAYGPFVLGKDQTPQERIREIIEQHTENDMKVAAARSVQGLIKFHYKKVEDPILLSSRHPLTGVSWRILAKAAQTADLKKRIMASLAPGYNNYEKFKVRYAKEAQELRDQGASWLPKRIPILDDPEGTHVSPRPAADL